MTLRLDKLGRLVVPKPLRDRFALAPGDELEVQLESDGFRLRRVQVSPVLVEKSGLTVCASEVPLSVFDLDAFLGKAREQRSREIASYNQLTRVELSHSVHVAFKL